MPFAWLRPPAELPAPDRPGLFSVTSTGDFSAFYLLLLLLSIIIITCKWDFFPFK